MRNETALQTGDKVFINENLGNVWEPYFGLVMTVVGLSNWGSNVYTTFDDKDAMKKAQEKSNRTPSPGLKSGEYSFSKCFVDFCPPVAFDLSEMV